MAQETEIEKQKKEIADYKQALDQSAIVSITDQKGIIVYANDNFCKVSKYSREKLIGQDHRIVNAGYHTKEFILDLWVTIAAGKIWKGEIKNKAKDGAFYWVDMTIVPFLNDLGKPSQYIAIGYEITNQKRAEEKHRMLSDSIDEGFCIIQMIFDDQKKPVDYRFLEINSSFEKQTGLRDAVGKRMREFAPNHEAHWFETYGKVALTGKSNRFENRAEQLNRWYDVYAFRWGEPADLQVAILFNDITNRKQAEEQLLELNKELESFSYSVAHDLHAPLRSVQDYASRLEDYEKILDAEGMRMVGNIKHTASKMGRLIDDLLAFSHLGRKEILFDPINMHELTEEVLFEINKSIPNKANIEIGDLPVVLGDYGLLYQVMINLVSNAVKYSSKKEKPIIQISAQENKDEIVFSVKDNGAGFDMKYAHKLFAVFERLHRESEFDGTGIGLATVFRIITKHGGKIWAQGKVEEGATFNFTLLKK